MRDDHEGRPIPNIHCRCDWDANARGIRDGELLVTVRKVSMSNRESAPYRSLGVNVEQPRRMSEMTTAYYDRMAEAFWDGTRDHDVSQNYAAFLDAMETEPPYSILDLGCGPGRDLRHFRSLGHNAVGLD